MFQFQWKQPNAVLKCTFYLRDDFKSISTHFFFFLQVLCISFLLYFQFCFKRVFYFLSNFLNLHCLELNVYTKWRRHKEQHQRNKSCFNICSNSSEQLLSVGSPVHHWAFYALCIYHYILQFCNSYYFQLFLFSPNNYPPLQLFKNWFKFSFGEIWDMHRHLFLL